MGSRYMSQPLDRTRFLGTPPPSAAAQTHDTYVDMGEYSQEPMRPLPEPPLPPHSAGSIRDSEDLPPYSRSEPIPPTHRISRNLPMPPPHGESRVSSSAPSHVLSPLPPAHHISMSAPSQAPHPLPWTTEEMALEANNDPVPPPHFSMPGSFPSTVELDQQLLERLEAGPVPSSYVPPPLHYDEMIAIDPYEVQEKEHSPSPPPHGAINPALSPNHLEPGSDETVLQIAEHWSAIQRRRSKRRVQLVRGNLVLDCPVPTKLLQAVSRRDHEEFTHVRYTAATCDPNDFARSNYTLRQRLYNRETELFIVVTMYNEDEILFCRTMHGVMKNIAHLCSRKRSKTWGPEGWRKVVVCIVADGRKKCDPRVLSVLASMGVYQEGIAKNIVNGKEVAAHIYEYTTQLSIDPDLKFKGTDKGIVPVQTLFCLKEKNQKKINSHRWFFNAFGPILQPKVCVLLDVGTRPGNTSIYHLWKAFDLNPKIGGACGEICTMKGTAGVNLLNPLVAAQNFEYKMSNILDKPLESAFGYISVLPGAFSAYRYIALQNDSSGRGPLAQYFKGEKHDSGAGIFTANMYLAEDRILCFELVAKKHSSWLLQYVKSAFGETDVPDAVPEFISQRRRWLNGSFFAAVYALYYWGGIWSTQHSFFRKMLLQVEFVYNFVSLIFSWFGLGNFYITFYYLGLSIASPATDPFGNGWGPRVFEGLRYLYLFLVVVQFVCALGNRPQGSKALFTFSMIIFGVIMMFMLGTAFWLAVVALRQSAQEGALVSLSVALQNKEFRDVIVSMASTYGVYFLASILYLSPWHMVTSFIQYMILLPSYINILNIYAFCNTHDVSWGTKGDNKVSVDLGVAVAAKQDEVEIELPTEQKDINAMYDEALADLKQKRVDQHQSRDAKTKMEDYYKSFRTHLVLAWIACNAILVAVITSQGFDPLFTGGQTLGNKYMSFLLWCVAGLAAFRFLGSIAYLIQFGLFMK
ncbi:uncharacterized protein VTP21DRAFT_2546 [Calcarisporiella thermophila]|uniref:uncharacterized protein n=1 Tax=Calcarisporiella thermophila TaxID=911321 RepID=UPI00374352F3